MKTDPSSERLLADVLLDDAGFKSDTLTLLLREARRIQTRRHRQRAGVLILALIGAVWGLWVLPARESGTVSQAEPSLPKLETVRSSPLAAGTLIVSDELTSALIETGSEVEVVLSDRTPTIPQISDSELFALLPDQPVALVGPSEGVSTAMVILPDIPEALVLP